MPLLVAQSVARWAVSNSVTTSLCTACPAEGTSGMFSTEGTGDEHWASTSIDFNSTQSKSNVQPGYTDEEFGQGGIQPRGYYANTHFCFPIQATHSRGARFFDVLCYIPDPYLCRAQAQADLRLRCHAIPKRRCRLKHILWGRKLPIWLQQLLCADLCGDGLLAEQLDAG